MSTRPRPARRPPDGPPRTPGVEDAPADRAAGPATPGEGRAGSGPLGALSGRRSRRTVLYDDQTARPGRKRPPPRLVEVRRVRRVLRRVDTWSVFRFAILLYLCCLVVFLAAVVGVWLLASSAGAIPSIETFITQLFALKRFRFKPGQLFLGTVGAGAVWVFVATLFTVLTAVLFNLISDVVGGIELTVLEEEPLDTAPPAAPAPPAEAPQPRRTR